MIRARVFLLPVFFFFSTALQAHVVADLQSPVSTDAKWILLTGTALTVAVIATQDSLSGPWETRIAKERNLGESSKYGDQLGQLVPNALYVGGMWVASRWGVEGAGARAWQMLEATAYAGLISTVLKFNIGEGRPYNSERGSSFPSGHSTTAFAFAGTVAAEHGWRYGVPALLLATFVAYSRINDNQHRTHDVVAGATIGLTCAYGIHYAHQAATAAQSVRLMPQVLEGGGGALLAQWNL